MQSSQNPCACDSSPSCSRPCAWKLFGGYQFNPYLGYELAIADMGQRSATLAGIGLVTARFRFFETVLTGTLPLGQRLSAYAKAGLFVWDIDYDLPPGFIGSADSNGNDNPGSRHSASARRLMRRMTYA